MTASGKASSGYHARSSHFCGSRLAMTPDHAANQKEEVHPFVVRFAVHHVDDFQHLRRQADAKLLTRFPDGRRRHRFAGLDVTRGDAVFPVLPTRVEPAQQQHARRHPGRRTGVRRRDSDCEPARRTYHNDYMPSVRCAPNAGIPNVVARGIRILTQRRRAPMSNSGLCGSAPLRQRARRLRSASHLEFLAPNSYGLFQAFQL